MPSSSWLSATRQFSASMSDIAISRTVRKTNIIPAPSTPTSSSTLSGLISIPPQSMGLQVRMPGCLLTKGHVELTSFIEHQVTPFNLATPDGETLYCWHVLPLQLYARNELEIRARSSEPKSDFTQTIAYQLLSGSKDAKVVINCKSNHFWVYGRSIIDQICSSWGMDLELHSFPTSGFI
jgi:hypothetical protein